MLAFQKFCVVTNKMIPIEDIACLFENFVLHKLHKITGFKHFCYWLVIKYFLQKPCFQTIEWLLVYHCLLKSYWSPVWRNFRRNRFARNQLKSWKLWNLTLKLSLVKARLILSAQLLFNLRYMILLCKQQRNPFWIFVNLTRYKNVAEYIRKVRISHIVWP